MKDIKELIYAAVEENALKFQELVNNQLQVRAYDAIEALRPEVGASMFGEAKKMEDDEEEMEDEDEDEEMEDEDEMDDKKKSMKEALHPNQQKIDVVDDEKIDAKDFAKLRKTKNEETQKNIFRNPKLPAKDQLKNPPKQIKVEEDVEAIDETSQRKRNDYIAAAQHRIFNPASTNTSPKKAAKLQAGIQRAEKGTAHVVLVHKAHTGNLQKTVDALKQYHGGTEQHPIKVHPPSGKYGPDHMEIHIPRSSRTGRNIESVKHTLSRANDGKPVTAAVVHGDTGEMHRIHEEVVNEVAMPKNAADWQAMINHQIKVTGHPVATDAQFRAPHGKDTSKIASQHSPEDMLNYATAQGGNVKQ